MRVSSARFSREPISARSSDVRRIAQARQRSRRALPVSRREDAVVPRPSRSRLLQVLRLRAGRRRDQVRAADSRTRPFPEALRVLANRAGIELEAETPEAARVVAKKSRSTHANELAAASFHRTLRLRRKGEIARRYAATRGLTRRRSRRSSSATRRRSGTAWCASSANGVDLRDCRRRRTRQGGPARLLRLLPWPLMIPTYATTGEVVAFGGRALDDSQPKYLNTSTTPVYTKGRALRAQRRAPRDRERTLIVVEGYLDCIALHQAGFTNAVASLGTAFTPEQAAEIRKYAERVFLCFDADAAGGAATAKSIDVLSRGGLHGVRRAVAARRGSRHVRAFARRAGISGALDAALPWIQFKLDREIAAIVAKRLPRGRRRGTAETLVRSLRARSGIAGASTSRERSSSRSTICAIRDSFPIRRASRRAPGPQRSRVRHVAPRGRAARDRSRDSRRTGRRTGAGRRIRDRIGPEAFREARYREIYRVLVARPASLATGRRVRRARRGSRFRRAAGRAAKAGPVVQSPISRTRPRAGRISTASSRVLAESRLERRWRELDLKIDEAFASGSHVSQEERDEHRLLGEEREQRKKKRLGT
jgi:DNA primase catalytic core